MSIIIGDNNANSLNGTNHTDIILGRNGDDTIDGGAGNDFIDGGNGNDAIDGGSGSDLIYGGNGNDTILGGAGNDIIDGGNGNDTLNGGAGSDLVLAGKGDDIIIHDATEANGCGDSYDGEQGRDTLRLIVSQAIYNSAAFQTELARFQSTIDRKGTVSGTFNTLDVEFSSIERIEVVIKAPSNQAPTDISLSASTIAENSAPGTVVANLSATDPDGPGAFTFAIVGTSDKFEVVGNELRVKADAVLDFETATSHQVTLQVTDAGGLTYQETVTISVTNINEAPTDISISDLSVDENTASGTVVATLDAIDPDLGDLHSFEIAGGGTDFVIVGNELRLRAGATLDHESAATQSITIRATDSGGQSVERTFNLSIADVNEAPAVSLANPVGQTAENGGAVKVADIVVSDDALGANQLSLSGADADSFFISGTELWFDGGANHEVQQSFDVRVHVDDSAAGGSFTDFSLSISDANDAPTSIALDQSSLNENNAGFVIGELSGVDEDQGETFTYTVDDARFEIVGSTIKLKDGISIDYESEPTILVTVTATDSGGASIERGFSLSVRDGFEAAAIDGYVAGATVFADANNNGALDAGEVSATTDAFGQFTLFGGTGPLVMSGGTDISTGKPFLGTMRAPEGSTVVTPLTTLVAAIADTGATVEEANDLVLAGLGLQPGVDLSSFDPIAATVSSDPILQEQGAASIAAAIQVQNTIVQAAAVLEGAGGNFGSATTSVVAAIASQISQTPNAEIDLGSDSVISNVISDAAVATSGVNTATVSDVIADVALVITSSNQLVETAAANSTGTDLLESLAQVSSVAQSAAGSLTTAVSMGDATSVVTDFTGTNLETAVETAPIGNVAGVNGDDTVTGTEAADTLNGFGGNDTLTGLGGNDILIGGDGNDILDGGAGIDRAVYADATSGITVALAPGTVSGAGVGTDTLIAVEDVRGSNFADTFSAAGFSGNSANAGSTGTLNGFEGMGGNDIITGNGNTLVSYLNAAAGVTVDLLAGTGQGIDAGDVANVGTDTFTAGVFGVVGSAFNDILRGSNTITGLELFNGNGGDDLIDGRGGFDRVIYSTILNDTVTGGVSIDMASGIVIGDASVGTDTLRSIESLRGSRFADSYVATGFGQAGALNIGSNGTFNEFEGAGGNDTITGNGNTRIAFYNATSGVTVDLAAGTATGDASVGSDTITGVNSITGSQFADTLSGSNNAVGTSEQFEGRAGNDTINGRGGFDQAVYSNDPSVTTGISVDMAAGTVTGDATVGTDTLIAIESVRGTNFADTYLATGFGGFNDFEGGGGNDTITGNGNTRISYVNATGSVTVDMTTGIATGNDSVGTDTFTGVSQVRGSNFNDTITGNEFNNNFDGQGGNDTLTGGAGNDVLTGGDGADILMGGADNDTINGGNGNDTITGGDGNDNLTGGIGSDIFIFSDAFGFDTITDFLPGQGDKIDLTGVAGVYDFATLQTLAAQSGPHTVIDFGGGNVLTLQNVTLASLTSSAFVFAANPAPTDLSLSADTVAENSLAGTVVGSVLATDNPGDTFTFELLDDAGGLFALNGNNELVVAGTLDYESATSHDVTIRVTDSANNTYEQTLTVQVTDVNEAPTDIALNVSTIAENSANDTVVGTLSASDLDAGDTATFTLLDDAGGLFALNGSNELVVVGALDYESATSHDVTIRVTDSANNTYEETLTIAVTNVSGNITGTPNTDLALVGTQEEDIITALGGDDILQGLAGDDILDGGTGNDRADYTDATGGITVNLSAGTVSGAGVGTDTLLSVESIIGSNFADIYNATGFGPTSINVPSVGILNGIEAMGGDDTIVGNGNTIVSYLHAAAGVTVDLLAGTGQGTDAGDVANVGTDTLTGVFAVVGSAFDDTLRGSNTTTGLEFFNGNAGDDLIDGRGGFDRVNYSSLVLADDTVTGGVSINMATGVVTGDASVDTDTLRGIEAVRGSRFADVYVATNFGATGFLNPALNNVGSNGTFNEFEGMHGNDTITGNGNTRIAFYNATGGVTVDLAAGTATGDDSVGSDTWSTTVINSFVGGINAVTGSQFGDTLLGSNNPSLTAEIFEGRAGNDTIDGRGGFDQAIYSNDSAVTSGISVTVAGGNLDWIVTGSGAVGTDTLTEIESIRGTNFADTFDATNFNGASTDTVPLGANFNEFEGMGGNDTITGNGNTRISHVSATAGVTVNLTAGSGTASGNVSVGTDTFTGVSRVRGSNFDDLFAVTSGSYTIEGQNGNDTLSFASFAGATGVSVNLGLTTAQTYAFATTVQLSSIEKLIGSAFDDSLTGSGNADTITGGGGDDTINGNAGVDIVIFSGARSDYTISGTTTLTVADIRSGAPDGIDSLTNVELLRFSDAFYMATTSFSLSGLNTIAGNTLFGTADSDTLTLTPLSNTATINLGDSTDTVVLAGPGPTAGYTLGLIDVENVTVDTTSNSNNVNETLNLTSAVNGISIDLGSGTDLVKVANGVNSLSVTNVESLTGSDFSGSSDDVLTLLNTVSGLSVNLANGTNSLNLAAGSNSFGDIWGVSTINGTVDDDTLSISGNASAVAIDLGDGTDSLNLTNGVTGTSVTVTNVESVNGTNHADTVVIANTSGSTTVVGGGGADLITASAGSDYFRFNASSDSSAGAPRDLITGFDASQDAFQFSSSGFAGVTFDYIDTAAFTGNVGQIRLDGNVLQIDLDGDGMVGSGDVEIELDNHVGTLSTANFLLV